MPAPLCAPKSGRTTSSSRPSSPASSPSLQPSSWQPLYKLLSRRVFPWRFPGESLGSSAVQARRKFVHGPEGRVVNRIITNRKTACAISKWSEFLPSSRIQLAYTIVSGSKSRKYHRDNFFSPHSHGPHAFMSITRPRCTDDAACPRDILRIMCCASRTERSTILL